MQEGYVLGSSSAGAALSAPMPDPRYADMKDRLVYQVYKELQAMPDIPMNEKQSMFRRQPPRLQGMTLTNPPNGGVPGSALRLLVGTNPAGELECSSHMPTLFEQPGYEDKRAYIGPTAPLTGVHGGETVYRTPTAEALARPPRGAMTVTRAEQEAASGRRRSQERQMDALAAAGMLPQMPQQQPQQQKQPQQQPQPQPQPQQRVMPAVQLPPLASLAAAPVTPAVPVAPRAGVPTAMRSTVPSAVPSAVPSPAQACIPNPCSHFWKCFTTSLVDFGRACDAWNQGRITPAQFWQQFVDSEQWVYIVLILIAALMLIMMFVAIGVGVSRDRWRARAQGGSRWSPAPPQPPPPRTYASPDWA
jgi:hypothetical protein